METKFNEKLFEFVAQKRFICLPNEATYNSILAALAKHRNGEKLEHNSNEHNYVHRYSIVSSNGIEKLFRGNQEVVKQEKVFLHCACFKGCETGKCKCKSLGRLCNSRCHNSSSCKNK
ncbi:hypothetical protein Ddc_06495 [Ditylenchus destructor]|nr:hypothetical protein Ddc_06495 [Ditylenchus destructor]